MRLLVTNQQRFPAPQSTTKGGEVAREFLQSLGSRMRPTDAVRRMQDYGFPRTTLRNLRSQRLSQFHFAIVSCSLDPESRSFALASAAERWIKSAGHRSTLVDLRESELPPFDNNRVYGHANIEILSDLIRTADGIVLAVPIYNWSVGSAAKNLVEATGSNEPTRGLVSPWFDQLVTFLVSGGLPQSYTHTPGLPRR